MQRLHKLFGLTVSFRFLRPLVPLLVRLPLGAVYAFLYVAWYGWSTRFRLEGTRKSWTELRFFGRSLGRNLFAFLKRARKRG